MRNRYTIIITVMLCLGIFRANAQSTDSSKINFGIWQSNAEKIKTVYYEMNGRLTNFNWKDLEVAPDVWVWTEFDSTFASLAKDKLPFVFMIYTKEDAPDWLYTNGVPKVNEKDNAGNITGYAPYYIDSDYKFFFKRMITTVRQHVERFPDSIRSQIAGVQACFGSTGDYISYKGTVEPQYEINVLQFYNLFTEFTQSYYQEYKNTSPKIYLLSNPSNDGNSEILWLLRRCPGGWIKTGSIGKGFQLNDEKAKSSWLYQTINTPQSGAYVRTRSEITGGATGSDWWLEDPYKNMFALMCYGIYWGLDMSNQGVGELENPLYDSSFNFFNKYAANASQKDPAKSTNAMCALKDVLDAADSTRFPSAIYGAVSRTNTQRFLNIADKFSIFGAKEGDVNTATLGELDNLYATAINDVGWDLLPGNYERFLHQIAANETSIGYWNVQSADTNSMYGRFARGFDIVNGKDGLYFDVDSSFLNNSPLVDNYPVIIDITYLDSGTGSFRLYYDSKAGSDKQSKVFTCTNSGAWKKASVTLPDAYFDNRGLKGADFYIKSINSQNVIFSIIELTRPNWDQSNVGVFCSPVPAFDTVCINGSVKAKSFLVSGSFLNGSALKIGPLNGYRFSLDSEGVYSDTITISNYGTSINKTVYVKLVTSTTGTFSGNLPVRGGIGSTSPVYVSLNGTVINSSPILSANVTSVTCNNYKNGSIDLSPSGGTGTFTYNWTTSGGFYFNSTSEDINQLKPAVYNVTVISQAACQTSASYTITEPEALSVNIIKDSNIICKGGSTTVTVTATGGNTPYNGTGIFSVGSGSRSYPVTDAKGCSLTKGLFVPDGTLIPPSKPSGITGANADAIGVCGNGNFVYTINSVGTATSYTWTPPVGTSIGSTNFNGLQVTILTSPLFKSGLLSVTANNVCGIGIPATKTLKSAPAVPGSVSGPKLVEKNKTGLVYSVLPAVSGVTYYWTASNGAKITLGQNSPSITVTWGVSNGKITVKAINECDTSSGTSVDVNVLGLLAEGSETQDPVSSAQFNTTPPHSFYVLPNPANDFAYLIFKSTTAYNFTIEVTDPSGKIFQRIKDHALKGENKIKIDVHNYTAGIYFITVTDDKGLRNTIKLLKD